MKLSELMIGDWVYVEKVGKPVRVESVGYTAFVGYEHFQEMEGSIIGIRPIELSKEIFEKNGFTSSWSILRGTRYYLGTEGRVYLAKSAISTEYRMYVDTGTDLEPFVCNCKYVHELQHILKVFGIEKEIVL